MSLLLDNVANCLSLAFASLHENQAGGVTKSKLKVLTANIGTLLDLYGVEKGLEHFKDTSCLDFFEYKQYLTKEVFSSLPEDTPLGEQRDAETKIAEVCWLVCRARFTRADTKLDGDSVFRLFRIFCFLADLTFDKEKRPQVQLHPAEAALVAQKLAASLGSHWDDDDDDFASLSVSMGAFPFAAFLAVLETRCLSSVTDLHAIADAVRDLHQSLIEDVMKKGVLAKRGYVFHAMRDYWFVLRPCELAYYKTVAEKERCGVIALQAGDRVAIKPDARIAIHTSERVFELAAPDHLSRLQWYSALQSAIECSGARHSYQRLQAQKRRRQRIGQVQLMLHAKEALLQEKCARKMAEGQAQELQVVVREDIKRLEELETIKLRLERLLEEETQAKQDEELVRCAQARLLAEEWERHEELEKLQEEQKLLLEEESRKRQEYEALQKQNEMQLVDAQRRLSILQRERAQLDDELKRALVRIKLSEDRKEHLEARMLEFGGEVQLRPKEAGERVRRAYSFMPSTKGRPVV